MNEKISPRTTRISQSTIGSLRPGIADWFIRDTMQPGFQVKVLPSGKAVYQVEARLGGTGKVKKFKLGNVGDIALADARNKAQEALEQIRSGIDPLQKKRAQLHEGKSLKQLIEAYLNRPELKDRTKARYQYLATILFRQWLNKRVVDITKHEIMDWYARGKNSPAFTDGGFRFLNSLMKFAMALEIISSNPCQLVTNAKMRFRIRPRSKHIELSRDLGRFLKAFISYKCLRDSERVSRDIILLILLSGLRKEEAAALLWENVDFERKFIRVPDTKNRQDHLIPMIPLTYSMLRYRQENSENSPFVFRIKGDSKAGYITSFQKTLTNICNQAGVSVVTAHDLRRTFATVLNSIGVGYADVKQLLNHRAKDITAGVYIQPDLKTLTRHLVGVAYFYDMKIPIFETGQGISQFTEGTLRYTLYKKGDMSPIQLDDPREEDPAWQEQAEAADWET